MTIPVVSPPEPGEGTDRITEFDLTSRQPPEQGEGAHRITEFDLTGCQPPEQGEGAHRITEFDHTIHTVTGVSLTRKRTHRTSPISSPLKLTRSPVSKMRRRYRTGAEQKGSALTSSSSTWQKTVHNYQVPSLKGKTIDDFKMNHTEIMSLEEVKDELHFYMLHKIALQSTESPDPFLNIQDFLSVTRVTHTEKS